MNDLLPPLRTYSVRGVGNRPEFRCKIEPFVPQYVVDTVAVCLSRLPEHVELKHAVYVLVIPGDSLYVTDFLEGFLGNPNNHVGLFHARDSLPRILLAGGHPRALQLFDFRTRRQALDIFVETICHEVVHYEQFRDGRPYGHRGVESRARSLARKVLAR